MRGSKPGERRGGRTKGTPNRATAAKAAEIAASGTTPLDYMLAVMRDSAAEPNRRDDMAKAAAPYVHPKLQAIEHSGPDGGPIEVTNLTDAQLAAIATGRGIGTAAPKGGTK
jgi:hypothetical protein